jgi:hypothetical protein
MLSTEFSNINLFLEKKFVAGSSVISHELFREKFMRKWAPNFGALFLETEAVS